MFEPRPAAAPFPLVLPETKEPVTIDEGRVIAWEREVSRGDEQQVCEFFDEVEKVEEQVRERPVVTGWFDECDATVPG